MWQVSPGCGGAQLPHSRETLVYRGAADGGTWFPCLEIGFRKVGEEGSTKGAEGDPGAECDWDTVTEIISGCHLRAGVQCGSDHGLTLSGFRQ